ncbi:MAG: methionyl-tRNA formyltransferase [Anaerolineales bacterium]
MSPRLVFLGTPEFSVPVLNNLQRSFQILGVVTQPDRQAGRGRKLISPAVKLAAESLSLEVYQPQDVNSNPALDQMKSWNPDLIIAAAFGQILSPDLLALPKHGCLNVHASLLPRWRGASPINAAILHNDSYTGITIMKMAEGLDDGPILTQNTTPIDPEETAGSLSGRLSLLGGELLVKTIPPYISGDIQPQPQDHSQATYAPLLKKKNGELDTHQTAEQLARKVRAYSPWPGTFTFWRDQRLIIHQAHAVNVTSPGSGVFTTYEGRPAVGTKEGLLIIEILQLAGKRKLAGKEFLRGTPDWAES